MPVFAKAWLGEGIIEEEEEVLENTGKRFDSENSDSNDG
jgi:hypothetical protein